MKVVFLDFDGVLNSHAYLRTQGEPGGVMDLDPLAVSLLSDFVIGHGAEVVVSSSWRHGRTVAQLRAILADAGFQGTVRGKTPDCAVKTDGTLWVGAMRGNEIQSWLDGAHLYGVEVESFVILDDDSDMAHLADRHVKTTMENGLCAVHVERAAKLLASPPPTIVTPSAEIIARFVP